MSEYRAAGVDYEVLDAAKRRALAAAAATSSLLEHRGGRAVEASRGEPAFVFTIGDLTLAIVVEGLGTKSVVARRYRELTGENHFHAIGLDTVAAIVNDLLCVGALPAVVNAYFAVGDAAWFDDEDVAAALVDGWASGCELAGAVWGGGESPALPGLVVPGEIDLAGAAVGVVPPGRAPVLGAAIAPGDRIVLLASTGLHANGASAVRKLADRLPDGYRARLPSGTDLGRAVLAPSHNYTPFVRALLAGDAEVTYLNHITGHGFRKLLRPAADVGYRVTRLPEVPEVLAFVVGELGMPPAEAYATFNMGAGFAVYCRPAAVPEVLAAAAGTGFDAIEAGVVEDGPRRLVIEPAGVAYDESALRLR